MAPKLRKNAATAELILHDTYYYAVLPLGGPFMHCAAFACVSVCLSVRVRDCNSESEDRRRKLKFGKLN